jgi:hypothetical protein
MKRCAKTVASGMPIQEIPNAKLQASVNGQIPSSNPSLTGIHQTEVAFVSNDGASAGIGDMWLVASLEVGG